MSYYREMVVFILIAWHGANSADPILSFENLDSHLNVNEIP